MLQTFWSRCLSSSNYRLLHKDLWKLNIFMKMCIQDEDEFCFFIRFGGCLYQLSFWRHPFTAEHPLLRHWWMIRQYLSLVLGEDWLGTFISAFIFQHVVFCWSVLRFEPHVFCLQAQPHDDITENTPPFRPGPLGSSLPQTIKNHKPLKPL